MSSSQLLPSNRTTLEAAVIDAAALRDLDPNVIRDLYDVYRCPPAFLPYLAWMLSVDFWELAESDEQRRDLIRNAIAWHKKRGTRWAIKQSLMALGIEQVDIDDQLSDGHWAEFDVSLTTYERPLVQKVYAQVTRLIEAYKPERSHLRRLIVSGGTKGSVYVGAATFTGLTITIPPYQVTEITVPPLAAHVGAGHYTVGTTTIYPRAT